MKNNKKFGTNRLNDSDAVPNTATSSDFTFFYGKNKKISDKKKNKSQIIRYN